MILDFSKDTLPGNAPYRMLDRDGVEVDAMIYWCDTDTGEVRIRVQSYKGGICIYPPGQPLSAVVFLRPPLRIVDRDGVVVTDLKSQTEGLECDQFVTVASA